MYNLVIRRIATEMARDAYEWYEEQQVGLGDIFLASVSDAIKKIVDTPLLFSKTYKNSRKVIVSKFPYVIIYEVQKKDVIVYAIFHTSRRPKKKYRKL